MTRWSWIIIASAPRGPEGVDDALDVLLVDDDVVGSVGLRERLAALRCASSRETVMTGPRTAWVPTTGARASAWSRMSFTRASPGAATAASWSTSDLQLADLFGLGGHVAVLVDDESGQVTAGGAQLGALGRGVARREEDAGHPGDDGDDERPGGRTGAALRHTLPPSTGVTCGGVQLR